jgi:molybdate transport system regulatory protein
LRISLPTRALPLIRCWNFKPAMKLILKFDFSGHYLGPGKIELLEHILEAGSISGAAKKMEMSYRRAWLLVDELNQMLPKPCVESSTGGSGGGGAKVTDYGRQVIATYRALERQAAENASLAFKSLK